MSLYEPRVEVVATNLRGVEERGGRVEVSVSSIVKQREGISINGSWISDIVSEAKGERGGK